MRRARGFTLIELMVVIVIIAGVAAAFALGMKRTSGDKGPSFVRSLLAAVHQARQAALSTGQPAQLVLAPGTGGNMATVAVQVQDPTAANGTWLQAGTITLPHDVDLCGLVAARNTSGGAPNVCPMTSTDNICFTSLGHAYETTGTSCSNSTSATAGVTIYVRTSDDKHHWLIPLWGLTGLPKLLDRGYTW